MSAAFSAIMIVGAFVVPEGAERMTEASTTRKFSIPFTLRNVKDIKKYMHSFLHVPKIDTFINKITLFSSHII